MFFIFVNINKCKYKYKMIFSNSNIFKIYPKFIQRLQNICISQVLININLF